MSHLCRPHIQWVAGSSQRCPNLVFTALSSPCLAHLGTEGGGSVDRVSAGAPDSAQQQRPQQGVAEPAVVQPRRRVCGLRPRAVPQRRAHQLPHHACPRGIHHCTRRPLALLV